LRGAEPAQNVGAFLERARRRQFADRPLETNEPRGSITGPTSFKTTPAITAGRRGAKSIARMPPRDVPTKTARPISRATSVAARSPSSVDNV